MEHELSREQVEKLFATARLCGGTGLDWPFERLLAHDAAIRAQREQDRQNIERIERISNNMHTQITYMIGEITRALKLTGDWTPAGVVDAIRQLVPMIEERDALKQRIAALSQAILNGDVNAQAMQQIEVLREAKEAAEQERDELKEGDEYAQNIVRDILRENSVSVSDGPIAVTKIKDIRPVIATLTSALAQARGALEIVSKYGKDGICHYGCDTPHIAQSALAALAVPAGGGEERREAIVKEMTELVQTSLDQLPPEERETRLTQFLAAAPTSGLVWTREKPTVNGWYWWTTKASALDPELVNVIGDNVMLAGDGKVYGTHSMVNGDSGYWYGPIQLPAPLPGEA